MNNQRHVKKLLSVFDLQDCPSLRLPKGVSSRVMFHYDEKANIKEFKILNRNITGDEDSRIRKWLHEHTDHMDHFPCWGGFGPDNGSAKKPSHRGADEAG
jgi:hypothetical protein